MDSKSLGQPGRRLLSELGLASAADVVLLATQCLRSGNYLQAISLCSAGVDVFQDDPALRVVLAMAELGQGHHTEAASVLASVRKSWPHHLVGTYASAFMHAENGDTSLAVQELRGVIGKYPDYPGALGMLSTLLMPGPSYREVLSYVHLALKPKTYLEIGVETGATLRLAQFSEQIVGVDPNLASLKREGLNTKTRLYAVTSDDFFATQSVSSVFDAKPLQLVFIDGMHRFEFALRDFCNVELWSNPSTVVIMHDVLPILPVVAERERQTKFWVGDVWKTLWMLAEIRNDLTMTIIPAAPSGLAIIRGMNRDYRRNSESWNHAVERYIGMAYPSGQPGSWPAHLRILKNTKSAWNEALGVSESTV